MLVSHSSVHFRTLFICIFLFVLSPRFPGGAISTPENMNILLTHAEVICFNLESNFLQAFMLLFHLLQHRFYNDVRTYSIYRRVHEPRHLDARYFLVLEHL